MEDKDLKILENIREVKAPPYLYDRIEARIQMEKMEKVPAGRAIVAGLAFALLLFFNVLIINKYINNHISQAKLTPVAIQMDLSPSNQLYHE